MRKILVVDDEPDVRKLLTFILERRGFRVETAEDGVAGLEAIGWFKPELVLLNVMMPLMDGLTMLQNLGTLSLPKRPRVVMSTGCGDFGTFDLSLSLGAVEYITYPVAPQELMQVVQAVFDPALSDAELKLQARLRRILACLKRENCALAVHEAKGLPFGELTAAQRRDLRERLDEVVPRLFLERAAGSRELALASDLRYPCVDPQLTLLALAQALV